MVTTTYNSQGMGLPASMTSNVAGNPNPVYDTTYNEWGELTSLRQGSAVQSNLLTTQFAYNVRGWLTNTLATTTNGTQTLTHLNMSYGYDANGNVKSLTNTGVTSPNSTTNPTFSNAYSYDWLDRLASGSSTAIGGGGASLFPTETYQYDNLDRMTTRSIGGVLYPYAYADTAHKDAPTSYHNNSYSYDANGDQLTGTVNGNSQSRTYDQERHLVQITSGSTTSTFIYDGNDQRIIQNVTQNLATTRTLYIGSFYEETLTGAPNPPYIVYYTLGGKMVGMRRANQPGVNTNGQFRVVGDQLGSTTLIIDTATVPNVTQREYYKPFGEVAFTSGSSRTDKGFTGQRLDSGSGLMYYGARYYDPVLSYFISPDTIAPNQLDARSRNRYSYVLNNPLKYSDVTGYEPDQKSGDPAALPHPNGDCAGENVRKCLVQSISLSWLGIQVERLASWNLSDLMLVLEAIADLWRAANWDITDWQHAMGLDPGGSYDYILLRRHTDVIAGVDARGVPQYYYGEAVLPGSKDPITGATNYTGRIAYLDLYDINFKGGRELELLRTVVHELAHVWDGAQGFALSSGMSTAPGVSGSPPASNYGNGLPKEEWAEAVAAMVFPQASEYNLFNPNSARGRYVQAQFIQYSYCSRTGQCGKYPDTGGYPPRLP